MQCRENNDSLLPFGQSGTALGGKGKSNIIDV